MRKRSIKQKGMALALAMLMLTLLALLTGAFFQLYESHYSLTRSSQQSAAASNGCEAIQHYITYRLEHDKTWGSAPFAGASDNSPTNIEVTEWANSHNISGEIDGMRAEFQAEILNNFDGTLGNPSVRAGTALCRVTCTVGTTSRNAEFVLRVAPLFDSSILTRADLDVQANSLAIRSRDENRNFVRAEGNIHIPDALQTNPGKSRFLQPDSNQTDHKGMLWAKEDIFSYHPSSTAETQIATGAQIQTAVTNTGGKIVPNAESHFQIYDMDADQLRQSTGANQFGIPGGRWHFTRRNAEVAIDATYLDLSDGMFDWDSGPTATTTTGTVVVEVLEYYEDVNAVPGTTQPTRVYRGKERIDDVIGVLPGTINDGDKHLNPDTIEVTSVVLDYPGSPDVAATTANEVTFGGGDLTFDLVNQTLRASSSSQVEIDGSFALSSDVGTPPKLELGFDYSGSEPTRAAIIAQGGIEIENGVTEGLGSLIALGGDINIQPVSTSAMEVSSGTSGMVVFSSGDIFLTNPNNTEDWDFKGLVYARGGVRMDGNGSESVTFEGSIVSLRDGANTPPGAPAGIEFRNAGDVEFIYNPDLLQAFVNDIPNNRVQLEAVYWKN